MPVYIISRIRQTAPATIKKVLSNCKYVANEADNVPINLKTAIDTDCPLIFFLLRANLINSADNIILSINEEYDTRLPWYSNIKYIIMIKEIKNNAASNKYVFFDNFLNLIKIRGGAGDV